MTQIAKNKEAIRQLKDGKISKFFASSQGDTNLPDSDDGRIVDLKLYGKSEQKQYKGVNLLPTGISYDETTERFNLLHLTISPLTQFQFQVVAM